MPPAVNEGDAELHARRAGSVAENPVGPERNSHYENSFFLFKIFFAAFQSRQDSNRNERAKRKGAMEGPVSE